MFEHIALQMLYWKWKTGEIDQDEYEERGNDETALVSELLDEKDQVMYQTLAWLNMIDEEEQDSIRRHSKYEGYSRGYTNGYRRGLRRGRRVV